MTKNVYLQVKDPKYFDKVREKMDRRFKRECIVRFGEMGKGISPNYQIESLDGARVETFSGLTHKPHEYEEFRREKITGELSYSDVQGLFRSVIS